MALFECDIKDIFLEKGVCDKSMDFRPKSVKMTNPHKNPKVTTFRSIIRVQG